MCAKTIVSSHAEINEFLFTSHEKRTTEGPPIDMKKNVELLSEEREGLKYILPAVKLRYTEGESSYGQF